MLILLKRHHPDDTIASGIIATMVKVVTDSTCDLAPDLVQRLGITVVPMVVTIDGKDYLDGVELTREQFYADLPGYHDIPKTAANSPGTLADAYREANTQGASQIVSIHIARKVSGVCAAADVAAADVANDGAEVRVVDSGSMSLGMGWLCVTAAEMAQRGASLAEVVRAVEAQRARTRIVAMADTLKYLAKGGRVSTLTAGVGGLLQIKLLVELQDGAITPVDRVRTRGRGMERLLDEVKKTPGKPLHYSILHSTGDLTKDFDLLRTQLQPIAPINPPEPVLVTPVIGSHFGPVGLGVVIVNA
jgi:DegV family protein with EDD domain